jgi:hypothetical protein
VGEAHDTGSLRSCVFVVFKIFPIPKIIVLWASCRKPCEEKNLMHDLLIALAFIGMIVAPAIAAATTNTDIPEETK